MISIITTTFKRPKELQYAIESVQKQTFDDWEHIIVHDGPADKETLKLMAKLKNDPRVRFIETQENHGNHTKPKNVGILASKGEYICYLDDDNEYCPTFMEVLKLELELSQMDVVYGLERIFTDREDTRGQQAISSPFDPQLLIHRSYIDTNTVMHRRDAVFQVGGWDETLPRFADWNLFVRMAKAGLRFKQVPIFLTRYFISKENSASRYPAKSWIDPQTGMTMFDPTWFSPAGCLIYLPYLGDDREEEKNPKVAIFSITYDRLDYTKKMFDSMKSSTEVPYDWFVFDNGSKDDTPEWLNRVGAKWLQKEITNKGLTFASNACIDEIKKGGYQIIGKVDNDCLFETKGWLETIVDLWKRNHMLYMAPYPEGLVDHPGGPWRAGFATLGGEYIEITDHLSGICAFIDARAYDTFRWTDKFLHGQQDSEASDSFVKQGYMPMIIPKHRIQHMDTTAGQKEKYPEYFERRKVEKTTQVERTYEEIQQQESALSHGTIWGDRVKDSIHRYEKYLKSPILDVGCNDGTAILEMVTLGFSRIAGVDIDKAKVQMAHKKGVIAFEGRLEKLPFKDKEFNSIFCSHTLEHAENIAKAISELKRVAKRLVLIVPIEQSTENPAHYSNIKSPQHLKDMVGGKVVFEESIRRIEDEYVLIVDV